MRFKLWPPDTIAWRLALTIALAVVVNVVLSGLLLAAAIVWTGRTGPPVQETGFLEQAHIIAHLVEAAPAEQRQKLVDTVEGQTYQVDWYPAISSAADLLSSKINTGSVCDVSDFQPSGQRNRMVCFSSTDEPMLPADLKHNSFRSASYFLGLELSDRSWVVFVSPNRFWGVATPIKVAVGIALIIVSIIIVSAFAAFQASRPIQEFTTALQRFGADPKASSIPEQGPRELRHTIAAFNAMQGQIQKFVDDRTLMLAAISHDLRTPLTKMRLRGEYIEDGAQRALLFRDVDDMTAMVESALSLFREDFRDEQTTALDFPGLLRTIADDFTDQGTRVDYVGPDHAVFRGRPFALKRAITNLVENAIKYGKQPELELCRSQQSITVFVRDQGPGIPHEASEQVFEPFFRLERSRNRATGGAGLGLTSARAVIRNHGGDISLCNRPAGGLEVCVTLPVVA